MGTFGIRLILWQPSVNALLNKARNIFLTRKAVNLLERRAHMNVTSSYNVEVVGANAIFRETTKLYRSALAFLIGVFH